MSYRALLFCADEKASRVVSQVFRELDFYIESSNEPFDAVKRLTGQHFDALVVDCDNEENATLLFKSARNSASNNNSLAVAVVEGQANIAKAFRLGANLVLTKPINLEQAKGTLRVARGLLRKAESAKLNAPTSQGSASAEPAPPVFQSVLTPVPVEHSAVVPTPVASLQVEAEAAKSEVAKSTAESLPAAVSVETAVASAQAAAAAPAKESQWTSKPEPLEPKPVIEKAPKTEKRDEPTPASARKRAEPLSKPDNSRFASLGIVTDDDAQSEETSKKNFWVAAIIVLALGGAAYFGWTKYHPAIKLPFVAQEETPAAPPPVVNTPKPPADLTNSALPPATTQPTPDATASTATPETKPAETPASVPAAAATNNASGLVKVPESVAEGLLVKRVDPNYPDQAKSQKVQGLVQLRATISKTGDVTAVKALHGNPLLTDAATEAVKQWKYKPYSVNGAPTSIETSITLTFKLP
jgi:TonB family protein